MPDPDASSGQKTSQTTAKPWFRMPRFMRRGLDQMPGQSRLGRLVFGLNLIGLLVLVAGALVLSEVGQGLIKTQMESLRAQADMMGGVIADVATGDGPVPDLDAEYASKVLARYVPRDQRARLFDSEGKLVADGGWIADSYVVSDVIDESPLPDARKPGDTLPPDTSNQVAKRRAKAESRLHDEVMEALSGASVSNVRPDEKGGKVVSVSIPLKRVKAVLGVLTIERGGVDEIVQKQRLAMLPFILVAFGVTMFSSLLLNWLVSRPIQRLSAAADNVRLARTRAISLPDLEERKDEIGTLARSLESMTDTLWRRMEEIDRFAADVSHEIKNPLTSIRSALETLSLVKDQAAKDRLMAVINQDVHRADRLITDISNASRLDAELSRDTPRNVEIVALLEDIISLYQQNRTEGGVAVHYGRPATPVASRVSGREGPLGQVFRNVIDNARSFSPEGGDVRVTSMNNQADPLRPLLITFDDDGPGIPEDNLETIFQRFYTSRPKGTKFGRNSGLGLSISRQIIEAHGGRIWAENRKDESGHITGARFNISLPTL